MNDPIVPQASGSQAVSTTRSFKFILVVMGIAMLLSMTVVSIYMPRMILWYFDPPTSLGISCSPSIHWALDRLLKGQLFSLVVGAVLGLLVGFKFRKKSFKNSV